MLRIDKHKLGEISCRRRGINLALESPFNELRQQPYMVNMRVGYEHRFNFRRFVREGFKVLFFREMTSLLHPAINHYFFLARRSPSGGGAFRLKNIIRACNAFGSAVKSQIHNYNNIPNSTSFPKFSAPPSSEVQVQLFLYRLSAKRLWCLRGDSRDWSRFPRYPRPIPFS